jgi:hypothetical protein
VSEILDRIAARYHDDRTRIEIPEWGASPDEPLVAYARHFTVADERRVLGQAKGDADSPETWARIVFHYLRDEDGEPIFKGGDFHRFIRQADATVVKRVGMMIFTATPSVEDAEGNSERTPA